MAVGGNETAVGMELAGGSCGQFPPLLEWGEGIKGLLIPQGAAQQEQQDAVAGSGGKGVRFDCATCEAAMFCR